jgi:hypothetical protein
MVPDRGLYTGIAIFGAINSGKTSCCMYLFAEQIRHDVDGGSRTQQKSLDRR